MFCLMMVFFVFMSTLMCVCFYYGLDPMKCSFFLVLSLIFVSPLISYGVHSWYSYFICLIFLSGVFVILVYFSSLSKFSYLNKPFWFVFFCSSLLVGNLFFEVFDYFIGINEFYYDYCFEVLGYLIFLLVFFLNFVSYYLSVGVAIRSM